MTNVIVATSASRACYQKIGNSAKDRQEQPQSDGLGDQGGLE